MLNVIGMNLLKRKGPLKCTKCQTPETQAAHIVSMLIPAGIPCSPSTAVIVCIFELKIAY